MNFKDIEGTGLKKIVLIKGGDRYKLNCSDLERLMRSLKDFGYKSEYEKSNSGFSEFDKVNLEHCRRDSCIKNNN